jgi:hypothetical protein
VHAGDGATTTFRLAIGLRDNRRARAIARAGVICDRLGAIAIVDVPPLSRLW